MRLFCARQKLRGGSSRYKFMVDCLGSVRRWPVPCTRFFDPKQSATLYSQNIGGGSSIQYKKNTMTLPANNPFRHRFDLAQAHDPIALQDAFNAMVGRAQGVLMLLSSHFEGESRINDETILSSIDAVFHDINDMKAAIKAHFDAVKVNNNSTAK